MERKAAANFDLQVLDHTPDTLSLFELTIRLDQDLCVNHWLPRPWKTVIIKVSSYFNFKNKSSLFTLSPFFIIFKMSFYDVTMGSNCL